VLMATQPKIKKYIANSQNDMTNITNTDINANLKDI